VNLPGGRSAGATRRGTDWTPPLGPNRAGSNASCIALLVSLGRPLAEEGIALTWRPRPDRLHSTSATCRSRREEAGHSYL
jgi:hypothetical protein